MKQVKKKRKFKKIVKILVVFIFIFLAIEYIYPFILNIFQNNIKDLFLNNFETSETISSYNTSTKGTILSRLKNLSKKDYRINKIIDNYDSYPEDLLDMLSRNIEMVDFVLDFPTKKGNVYIKEQFHFYFSGIKDGDMQVTVKIILLLVVVVLQLYQWYMLA